MSRFEKGRSFAKKHAAEYGVGRATSTLESIIAANPGRSDSDDYVRGLRAGLAEASPV